MTYNGWIRWPLDVQKSPEPLPLADDLPPSLVKVTGAHKGLIGGASMKVIV